MADSLLIAARALHLASLVQLLGVLFFRHWIAAPVGPPLARRFSFIAWMSLVVALASGILWLLIEAAQMSGQPLALGAVATVLQETQFGRFFLIRFGLAVLLAIAMARPLGLGHWLLVPLAAALLAGIAWAGHAAAEPGFEGHIHLCADIVHLVAAGAWLGGLLPLALYLAAARPEDARAAARRFSATGVATVAALIITGLVNATYLVGSLPGLIGTPYGRLLSVKILVFAVLMGIASVNRFHLLPRLGDAASLRQLRINALLEVALGASVLGIVGALGTKVPALHSEPSWPLPVRFSAAVLDVPELRGRALTALGVAGVGLALVAAAIRLRRAGWLLAAAGLALVLAVVPGLRLFTVVAYPTSFARSPTGYSAQSIAAGEKLFAANCSRCHGAAEADLTAADIYDHPDGDLYWWISHGMAGTTMPGFAAHLTAEARWNLVDFIHANADGARLDSPAGGHGAMAVRAPDFAAQCPDGSTATLAGQSGRIVLLVFAGPAQAAQLPALHLPGLETIIVPHALAPADTDSFCTAREPELPAAYGLLIGRRGGAIDGSQFIIDGAGALRAAWSAPLDAATLAAAVDEIAREPAAAARPAGHVH